MPEEGKIGKGRGGRIWAWMAEEVEDVVEASVRGEEGEYHHCESLRRSRSGGRRGGSFDQILVAETYKVSKQISDTQRRNGRY
jgi:hypothetical protein